MSADNGELAPNSQPTDSQHGNNSQHEIARPAETGSSNSQPGETLAKTLSDINVNMGTMASLLQTIVVRQDSKREKKRRHGLNDLSSTDSESEDNDHERSSKTGSKRRREDDE